MDIITSLLVIVLIYPWLFPMLFVLIRLDSKGPVFFRQQRVGFLGRTFWCYKFRTMYVNNCSDTRRASTDDPRVTRIGRFLRNTCLDELPQFLNVLLGHMSVVGPRPHMLHDSREFASLINNYRFRDMVRPGITGLSQVRGYRGPAATFESILRRYQWDSFYVRNVGFRLDLRIMLETVILIIQSLVHRNRPVPADNLTIDGRALATPNKKIA